MNLPLFFYDNTVFDNEPVLLNEETSRHVVQVLRMKVGEKIQLTDGKGNRWITSIVDDHKKKALVRLEDSTFTPALLQKTALAISLVKNSSRFEWFLEKATEIGVTAIIPLICDRTEKQHFRYDRMKGILISAMLQSSQAWMPTLEEPMPFSKFVENASYDQKFIAHCEEDKKTGLTAVAGKNTSSVLLIGPEGDFTKEEISLALAHAYTPVTLGQTRLRTETAGIVGATLLKFTAI